MSRKPNETVMSFLLSSTGAQKIGEDVVRTKYDAVTGPSAPLAAGKNLEIWGLRENHSLVDGKGSRGKNIGRISSFPRYVVSRLQDAINEVAIVGPSNRF